MLLHFHWKNKHHKCTFVPYSLPTSRFDLYPLKIIAGFHFAKEKQSHRTLKAKDNTEPAGSLNLSPG
ncbi:hypothetical protein [Endozoicomonas sp. ONNA2]|uniref:hypothetical protein n=1 Tax=Endozoicomonas sp. ONNA2 TaxID=2828741 RepID=UPI002147722C|nr:hypothetical protein [Endozoicomonas sp. ONNA2]